MLFSTYDMNCKDSYDCTRTKTDPKIFATLYIVIISVASFGFITNWISYYIFANCPQSYNRKFISTIKIYILNSFFYCLVEIVTGIYWVVLAYDSRTVVYYNTDFIFSLSGSYGINFFFTYIRTNVSAVLYTFGGYMDTYIAFERIKVFRPNLILLQNSPVAKVSFFLFILSFLISLPINLSRQVLTHEFNITDSNNHSESVRLYTYELTRFTNNEIFRYFIYIANSLRDVVPMVLEIVFHIILIYFLREFYLNRSRIHAEQENSGEKNFARHLSRVEKTNLVTSFIICILSIFTHTMQFSVFISKQLVEKKMFNYMNTTAGVFVIIRHSMNIFIFLASSNEFRQKIKYIIFDAE